ncbi:histidine phosphatase [Aureococcus anophagefferens]|jgi:2,3-bisphosphoglycerate-dependent phosphoglycerate mutase|uniref:Phosphoglycerate mutase n=2 Tax=Aureococcus anophagefferens TaxID=44056 RepID=A0ABR1G4G3_AURAN|mmetsp:Transcript_27958/g.95308  ORF Transcript_27958/g.95308 Transcript_27958/m.95308 type:complete len:345 (-) Transcript_27958:70-1104(-)
MLRHALLRRRPPGGAPGARPVSQLVLLRHGQSEWNASKRFTGWVDVDLSEQGRSEAIHAGIMLKRHGFEFDEAHTSLLKRATRTLWSVMHSCDQHWIVVKRSWRLNERHYGALTGMSKAEVEAQMGTELLQKFRRGYDKVPIEMRPDHPFWTGRDRRYHDLGDVHPRGESLRMCQSRVLPYWVDRIAPSIRRGKRVLVCAHNNVLRVLVQHLDSIPPDQIREIEIPTGIPLVYRLDDELRPVGPRDAVGFRGKFLVDSERRDAEYLANAETINHFKERFDRVVHPVEQITREEIDVECRAHHIKLPSAWANLDEKPGKVKRQTIKIDATPPAKRPVDVTDSLGH